MKNYINCLLFFFLLKTLLCIENILIIIIFFIKSLLCFSIVADYFLKNTNNSSEIIAEFLVKYLALSIDFCMKFFFRNVSIAISINFYINCSKENILQHSKQNYLYSILYINFLRCFSLYKVYFIQSKFQSRRLYQILFYKKYGNGQFLQQNPKLK